MATIRQAKSGLWQAIVKRKGHPLQSRTFEKHDDAEKWARDIESKIDRDVFVDRSTAESTTLGEALDNYERDVSSKKDGYEVEKVRIAVWKRDQLAKRSMASLKPADFARWLANRLEHLSEKTGNTISPVTARKELAIISHLFTVAAKRWGMAVTNPIEKIELPTEDNSRDRRLDNDELKKLFDALGDKSNGKLSNNWMLPLAQLAVETGARQSELLALKWVDIDLVKSKARIQGKERLNTTKRRTKNGDKFRDVPLSSAARAVLSGMPRSITGNVFPTTASAVKQSWARACKRAGIEDYHFHDLRHEATSRLAEKLQMHELMKVTGHKDTRMLARYYHPRVEDLARKLG